MEKINDGGSAFGEFKQAGNNSIKAGGLTIRDYFAAKAMQAALSNEAANQRACRIQEAEGVDLFQLTARGAYLMADAMIAERQKQKEVSS